MANTTLLSILVFAAGPLDEIDAARSALNTLAPEQRSTIVYVSMLGVDPQQQADVEAAFDLALNQTTFRRKPLHLAAVVGKSRTLYSFDAEDTQWSKESLKRLLAKEPYFYPLAPDVAMIRADWFVREASFGATYYDLLGFGKTLADVDKRVGLDRNAAANLRSLHGARVVESGVALHSRAVARFGSPLGAYWQTFDVADAKNGNPFEKIDELTFGKFDATEVFGPLPNGLFWWALANGKGELQNAAPTNIAADRRAYVAADKLADVSKERPSYRIVEVQNAHSCMGCHATGLRSAPDYVAATVADGKLELKAYDKGTAGKIEDFFDQRSQAEAMVKDSLAFTRAVERVTGRTALDAANVFARIRWTYSEALVPIEQAAREVNVAPEVFAQAARAGDDVRLAIAYWLLGKGEHQNAQAVLGLNDEAYRAFQSGQIVPLGSNTLRSLVTGTSIPRDLWEQSAYREAALLVCYQQSPRNAATRAMVQERMQEGGQAKPVPQTPERRRATDAATGRPIEFNEKTGQWEFSAEAKR